MFYKVFISEEKIGGSNVRVLLVIISNIDLTPSSKGDWTDNVRVFEVTYKNEDQLLGEKRKKKDLFL